MLFISATDLVQQAFGGLYLFFFFPVILIHADPSTPCSLLGPKKKVMNGTYSKHLELKDCVLLAI